jgi:hypothetical protein
MDDPPPVALDEACNDRVSTTKLFTSVIDTTLNVPLGVIPPTDVAPTMFIALSVENPWFGRLMDIRVDPDVVVIGSVPRTPFDSVKFLLFKINVLSLWATDRLTDGQYILPMGSKNPAGRGA